MFGCLGPVHHSITNVAAGLFLLLFWLFCFSHSPFPCQGTEFKLYESPKLDMEGVQADWARLLNSTVPRNEDLDQDHLDLEDESSFLSQHERVRPTRPPPQVVGNNMDDQSLLDVRQFPNSFRIAGLKHVSDNALKGLLEGTRTWKALIPRLRAVEILLKGIMNRQRLSHSCVTSEFPAEQKQLECFSASLKGLRWHAVSVFSAELIKLERILRC